MLVTEAELRIDTLFLHFAASHEVQKSPEVIHELPLSPAAVAAVSKFTNFSFRDPSLWTFKFRQRVILVACTPYTRFCVTICNTGPDRPCCWPRWVPSCFFGWKPKHLLVHHRAKQRNFTSYGTVFVNPAEVGGTLRTLSHLRIFFYGIDIAWQDNRLRWQFTTTCPTYILAPIYWKNRIWKNCIKSVEYCAFRRFLTCVRRQDPFESAPKPKLLSSQPQIRYCQTAHASLL